MLFTTNSVSLVLVVWLTSATGSSSANLIDRFFGSRESEDSHINKSSYGADRRADRAIAFEDGVLMAPLSNHQKMPLVGVGVGNSPHEYVDAIVAEALQDNRRIRLVDTSHASGNEDHVADGIIMGVERMERTPGQKVEVHVVTKVWYTHLGYERTKISVEESLYLLQPAMDHAMVDLKLHVFIHWPRCYADIEWMDCENEEARLPEFVRQAGPNPADDPDNAWKESWKYLEDLFLSSKYPIASIGVSNFHLHEIEEMKQFARVMPHVLQVSLWSLLYDSMLVDYCQENNIHMQVYNTMHGTIVKPEVAPHAFHHIQKVANEITEVLGLEVTPAQVIHAWLIQHGISVAPRTSRLSRLEENSAIALSSIPLITDSQEETIAHAVEAYLSGNDIEQDLNVSVTFHAVNKDIMLYWLGRYGTEESVVAYLQKGETFNETTYPHHMYRTYDALNKDVYIDHEIQANYGEHKKIMIELS